MSAVFVDTLYFVALFNPRDQWHQQAVAASQSLINRRLITTEDVLVELLNFCPSMANKLVAALLLKWKAS